MGCGVTLGNSLPVPQFPHLRKGLGDTLGWVVAAERCHQRWWRELEVLQALMLPWHGCVSSAGLPLLNAEKTPKTQEKKTYLRNEATSPHNPDEGHWMK